MNQNIQNLLNEIPPAKAMGITVSKQWKNGLELCAPFECNLNDKGTAFAGSIASLLTLAGWGLLTLQLRERALEPEIMVVTSAINYTRPAKQMLSATTEISDAELERIRNDLLVNRRSRMRLCITLRSGGIECANATADYALIGPS